MADEELSSSDSDADYVPGNDEDQAASEDESDSEVEDELVGDNKSSRKRKGKCKEEICNKRTKNNTEEINQCDENVVDEDTLKKRTDELWTDFKNSAEQQTSQLSTLPASTSKTNSNTNEPVEGHGHAITQITKTYEFAGEKVEVVEPAAPVKSTGARGLPFRRGGGITSVLGQLGKKNKLSTLEKSKLDWESYKHSKGLAEEIETHNRGKHGYLEKQDFLMRTDLRQFELEKKMRATSRRNNL